MVLKMIHFWGLYQLLAWIGLFYSHIIYDCMILVVTCIFTELVHVCLGASWSPPPVVKLSRCVEDLLFVVSCYLALCCLFDTLPSSIFDSVKCKLFPFALTKLMAKDQKKLELTLCLLFQQALFSQSAHIGRSLNLEAAGWRIPPVCCRVAESVSIKWLAVFSDYTWRHNE